MNWCILVKNESGTTIVGPFGSPWAAAKYAAEVLGKPVGQTAVCMPMQKPDDGKEEPQNVRAKPLR